MNSPLIRAHRPGPEAARALAQHLEAFAARLSPRERMLLVAAVERAMAPLDRIEARDAGEMLDETELRLLAELLATGDNATDWTPPR